MCKASEKALTSVVELDHHKLVDIVVRGFARVGLDAADEVRAGLVLQGSVGRKKVRKERQNK